MPDDRKSDILNRVSINNNDRLVNAITGERESGIRNTILPSDLNFYTDSENQQTFNDVTDVNEYLKYGVPVTRHSDYNYQRAVAQPHKEQIFNMFKQMGTTVAGETISGFGAIPALFQAIIDEAKGGDADLNNAMMELGNSIENYGKQKAPIYREHPNESWDVSDLAWWTQNGVSVASSFGLMVPGLTAGYLVGKGLSAVGKLARIANIAGKGTKFTEALGTALASGNRAGQAASYYSRLATSAFVMRNGENLKESLQTVGNTYNNIMHMPADEFNKFISQSKDETVNNKVKEGASRDEIASYIASRAGWRNYALDAGNVVFDMIQLAPLFRGIKPDTRSFFNLSSVKNLNRAAAGQELLSKGEALANNLAYYGIGTTGFEGITEGIEEAVNFYAQGEGMHYGKYLLGQEKDKHQKLSKYMQDPQMWEQAFWGSIGGVLFTSGERLGSHAYGVITDPNFTSFKKTKLDEITERTAALGIAMNQLKTVDEGYNPFVTPNGEPQEITSQEEAEDLRTKIIDSVGDHIGLKAASRGNVNLVLEMLDSPEYKQQATEQAGDKANADLVIKRIRDRVLEAEKTYRAYYSNLIVRDIPDHLKGVLISEATNTNREINSNKKQINNLNTRITEKLSNEANTQIREAIDEEFIENPNISFTQSLNKAGLEFIKKDLQATIKKAEKYKNDLVVRRANNAINEIDKALEDLSGNLNGTQLQERGVTQDLIEDVGVKQGLEMLVKGMNQELSDILVNTEEYAKKVDKDLKDAARQQAKETFDKIKAEVRDINPSDEDGIKKLNRLKSRMEQERKRNQGIRDMLTEYKKIIDEINNKLSDAKTEYKRRQAKSSDETLPHETTREKQNQPESVPVEEEGTDTGEEPIGRQGNVSFSTGKTTEGTSEPVSNPEEEIKDKQTNDNVQEDVGTLNDDSSYDGKLSLYISSIANMDLTVDPNGIISLTDEQAKIWDILTNKLKQGDKLYIRYDDNQTLDKGQKSTRYNKRVAVYDKDGNLLFHIPTITEVAGVPMFNHSGMYYGSKSNWIKRVSYLLNSNRFKDELNAIFDYKRGVNTNNTELINKAKIKLNNSALFRSIASTNREKELTIDSIEYLGVLEHIVNVITNGIKHQNLNSNTSIQSIINSINEHSNKISADIDNTMRIRNLLLDTPDLVIETSVHTKQDKNDISGKNIGSFIHNYDNDEMQLTTVNNTVGKNTSDKNIPLYIASSDVYGQIDSADGTKLAVGDVERPAAGILYLGLKMATVDGTEELRFVRTTYGNTSQLNVPDNVLDYNEKLLNFISFTLRNSKDLNSAYNILRHYVVLDQNPKDKSSFYIRTVKQTETGEYRFKVYYDSKAKELVLNSPHGKVNLAQSNKLRDFTERAKEYGIRRNVTLNKNKLNNKPFVDQVTDTKYNTYTEYLVDTGAILSEFGSVRDKDGNLISNSSPTNRYSKNGYNMKVYINVSPDNVRGAIIKKKAEDIEVKEKYTSLDSYASALIGSSTNPYTDLFNMFDKLGIVFDSTIREELDEIAVLRVNKTTNENTLILSSKFDSESAGNRVRLLAHESIHAIVRGKINQDHLDRLSNINDRVNDKLNTPEFANQFNETELSTLKRIVDISNNKSEEVITYGLTNSVYAKALQSIKVDDNISVSDTLVKRLLDLIRELISATFGNTALDEVGSILEDILTDKDGTINPNSNDITPDDLNDTQKDILDNLLNMKAEVSDVITTIPNAVEFLRTLNKEDRATARDMINNGSLIFKCR